MYWDFVNWALSQQGISPNAAHVLLVLSVRTDKEKVCFPSWSKLIEDTKLSKASIARAISELEKSNLISIKRERGSTNKYLLNVKEIEYDGLNKEVVSQGDQSHRETSLTERLVSQRDMTSLTERLDPSHSETYKNKIIIKEQANISPPPQAGADNGTSKEAPCNTPPTGAKDKTSKGKPDGYPEDFEKFWQAYPRKDGKKSAFKAWRKSAKERPPLEVLLAKVELAALSEQWQNKQYIPHASTWLNGYRWEDESLKLPSEGWEAEQAQLDALKTKYAPKADEDFDSQVARESAYQNELEKLASVFRARGCPLV